MNSSDEDEFLEERTGTCFNYFCDTQPNFNSRACNKDTCFIKHHHHHDNINNSNNNDNNNNNTSSSTTLENDNFNNHNNNVSSCSSSNNNCNQPDLLKDVLVQSRHVRMKLSQTENDLRRLEMAKSASFDVAKSESFSCLRGSHFRKAKKIKFPPDSINLTKTNDDDVVINKSALKKKRNPLARSCITQ